MKDKSYCLITPCRNEAKFAQRTIESVLKQTIQPAKWIFVNDGSSDETPAILKKYAVLYNFIKIIHRKDRGKRAVGAGVIEAFNVAYKSINPDDFSYICKFDLDLDIPAGYFEQLMLRMEAEPRLGTCSGKPYYRDKRSGKMISEKCGDEMSVGMTKFYRTQCFQEIGGFVRQVMWDGIDCHTCRMKGWLACSWDDPAIRFEHLRPMGSSEGNIWRGRTRHGFGQYFMGTSFPYMLISAMYRMTRPPRIIGGVAMLWGYTRSLFKRETRYANKEFKRFLNKYQWSCLIQGKVKATDAINSQILKSNQSLP